MNNAQNKKTSRRQVLKSLISLGAAALLPSVLKAHFSEQSTEKKRPIHFVGLGGAGSEAVRLFHNKGLQGFFTCLNTGEKIDLSPEINFIDLEHPRDIFITKEGKRYDLGPDTTKEYLIPQTVWKVFEQPHRFVLLSGLGGYTGGTTTKEISLHLYRQQKDFYIIGSLPFSFEKSRIVRAQKIIQELKHLGNVTTFELNSIAAMYGNMRMSKAIEKATEQFYTLYQATSWA
ncbi:MAG: hypothetical protein JST67_06205 [Bacteroidetes bacterium]|nr:hypothetical protein [Bacteroidota bacterium]